ncbi:MAG: hypothetical protein AAFN00_16695 [Cyanobacteria bacterium J06558_2]
MNIDEQPPKGFSTFLNGGNLRNESASPRRRQAQTPVPTTEGTSATDWLGNARV